MNPLHIFTIWSFKKELTYVALSFLFVLLIPVIAVILLTNAGIDIVSDHLATQNPQTHAVDIHDPANGNVIATVNSAIVWPMKGVITLEFGQPDPPYQPLHTGIDIADPNGKEGDSVIPFMEGKVTKAEQIWWGYGKYIEIDHGNNIVSIYAHLSKIFVFPGEKVKTDQVIGLEGQTGWATGPHVHFQINVFGIPVNPRTFVTGDP